MADILGPDAFLPMGTTRTSGNVVKVEINPVNDYMAIVTYDQPVKEGPRPDPQRQELHIFYHDGKEVSFEDDGRQFEAPPNTWNFGFDDSILGLDWIYEGGNQNIVTDPGGNRINGNFGYNLDFPRSY